MDVGFAAVAFGVVFLGCRAFEARVKQECLYYWAEDGSGVVEEFTSRNQAWAVSPGA